MREQIEASFEDRKLLQQEEYSAAVFGTIAALLRAAPTRCRSRLTYRG